MTLAGFVVSICELSRVMDLNIRGERCPLFSQKFNKYLKVLCLALDRMNVNDEP